MGIIQDIENKLRMLEKELRDENKVLKRLFDKRTSFINNMARSRNIGNTSEVNRVQVLFSKNKMDIESQRLTIAQKNADTARLREQLKQEQIRFEEKKSFDLEQSDLKGPMLAKPTLNIGSIPEKQSEITQSPGSNTLRNVAVAGIVGGLLLG